MTELEHVRSGISGATGIVDGDDWHAGQQRLVDDDHDAAQRLLHHSRCTDVRAPLYTYPRTFDLSDERNPRLVSELFLEVDDPANCAVTSADVNGVTAGIDAQDAALRIGISLVFQYDVHHCTPDRPVDSTIMACPYFKGGVRVLDIRDPLRPRDLAYVNVGTLSPTDPTIDVAVARPVFKAATGELWWVTLLGGLHTAKFADGALSEETLRCPTAGTRTRSTTTRVPAAKRSSPQSGPKISPATGCAA